MKIKKVNSEVSGKGIEAEEFAPEDKDTHISLGFGSPYNANPKDPTNQWVEIHAFGMIEEWGAQITLEQWERFKTYVADFDKAIKEYLDSLNQ